MNCAAQRFHFSMLMAVSLSSPPPPSFSSTTRMFICCCVWSSANEMSIKTRRTNMFVCIYCWNFLACFNIQTHSHTRHTYAHHILHSIFIFIQCNGFPVKYDVDVHWQTVFTNVMINPNILYLRCFFCFLHRAPIRVCVSVWVSDSVECVCRFNGFANGAKW